MTSTQEQKTSSAITEPDQASKMLELLSVPRLQPYVQAFKPNTNEGQLGAYLWGQAVSASLYPFLGIAEVIIRNAIHQSLSKQCSKGNNVSYPWYDRAADGSILLKGKSQAKVEELLFEGTPPIRKATQPSPDLVVSRLSFGFWPNVMEELNQRYAPQTFLEVFSHHPHSTKQHWSFPKNKEVVILRLKRLQDLRNRVCHFEAIWKHHWLGASGPHWSHAVKKLRDLHAEMLELVGWCSPVAVTAYKDSFGHNWFSRLCTTGAVAAFMADERQCARLEPFAPAFPSGDRSTTLLKEASAQETPRSTA